jgi:hypothetical protein
MGEFSRKPKFKIGDLVSLPKEIWFGDDVIVRLGIIVEVRPSTIKRLPIYWVHLPSGKRCNSPEDHLEFANV